VWFSEGTCNKEEAVVHAITVVKLITTKPNTTASIIVDKNYATVTFITDNTLQPTLV
jgi:hypothetical protein